MASLVCVVSGSGASQALGVEVSALKQMVEGL